MAAGGPRHWDLPLDPDLDAVEDARHHPGAAVEVAPPPWPRLPADVVVAVFLGGCVGGVLRYAVVRAWPGSGGAVPWSTLVVNLAGAFVLAVVLVAVTREPRHPLLRPLLGTGFCGALTTFSAFAVVTDRLAAHDHLGAAAAYLALTTVGSLVAALAGYLTARAVFPSG
jgi:CrcB protein